MITRTICGIVAFALGLLTAQLAEAQQPARGHRIGVLLAGSRSSSASCTDPFREGLRELGYIEGQHVAIEYRYAEGKRDRLPDLAAELVRLKVDVIVGGGGSQVRAARNATEKIPIVMAYATDPVARGYVASLARSGGNITGLTALTPDLGGKRLELLREILPKLTRVAVVGIQYVQGQDPEMSAMEVAARTLGLQLQPVELRGPEDLEKTFLAITRGRADALIGLQDLTVQSHRGQIADLAVKSRLPTVAVEREHVKDGWLMSYGPDYSRLCRRAATYVDKILKGAKPADLPVEQPTVIEMVINLKTAKALGLTIPQSVLFRADQVIK